MKDIPLLIALDMDGSLCTTDKRITPYTAAVLERAAAAGALIVPATGRFYKGLPAELRDEPFLRYCITINGAHVYDAALDRTVSAAELPLARALDAMEYLDSQDVIYDCYQGDWGWITRRFWEIAPEYVPDRHYLKMLRVLREPVDELKAHLRKTGRNVQKILIYTHTDAIQDELLKTLPVRFPDMVVTSSARHNIELNAPAANKGAALRALAEALEIPRERVMAVGDGLNDRTMLEAAGLAVAMGNAHPAIKAIADYVTDDCDHDGAAKAIERFCLAQGRGGVTKP